MKRIAAILPLLFLQGCFSDTSCEYDSESVAFAKSLSQERLTDLYRESIRLLSSSPEVYISPVPDECGDFELQRQASSSRRSDEREQELKEVSHSTMLARS